jgi:predicted nucleic acid-binding protein
MRVALLDANVLHPMCLCDLFLRLAIDDFYRPLWSAMILEETARSVHRRRRDLDRDRLDRRMRTMKAVFPGALVEGHERFVPKLRALGKDAHVLAAAIEGGADVIVTSNLKDFPNAVLRQFGVAAVSPDDFLVQLWKQDPDAAVRVLREQAAMTKRPPLSLEDILLNLESVAVKFVALVRESL